MVAQVGAGSAELFEASFDGFPGISLDACLLAMNTVFHQEGRDNEPGYSCQERSMAYRIPGNPENFGAGSAKGVLGREGIISSLDSGS